MPIQRTRGSPISDTMRSESSVQPSPTTRSSKSVNVWSSTLPIEYGSTVLQLYGGMMTVTRGMSVPARAVHLRDDLRDLDVIRAFPELVQRAAEEMLRQRQHRRRRVLLMRERRRDADVLVVMHELEDERPLAVAEAHR